MNHDELKRILDFFPETGKFFWKINRRGAKSKAGELAGSAHSSGYIQITVNKKLFLAHRLAWFYVTGAELRRDEEIDHINGDKKDNRFSNLRKAAHAQNIYNISIKKDNTSGKKGVFWSKQRKTWFALVVYQKKRHYIGSFKTLDDAAVAAAEKRKELHGDFAKD